MEQQSRSRRKPGTTARARTLRSGENPAEGKLWLELQDRRLGGYKFVRQFPVGPYYADFLCRKANLVVEIDGSQHADSTEYDGKRNAFMRNQGYAVIRFWHIDVRQRIDEVCETILAALDGRLAEDVDVADLTFVSGLSRLR